MSGLFATKWDFLHASVLIGVDRSTGVFSGSEPAPGQQMVCVWSTDEIATDALHVESWDIRQIRIRDLLTMIPDGIGVVVDPERPSGMTASAAYVANVRRLIPPFPVGAAVRLQRWDALPVEVRTDFGRSVVDEVSDLDVVRELYSFTYTVDDSPAIGCLAYIVRGSHEDTVAATRALEAAVADKVDLATLGVATIHVLSLEDLPAEVRSAIGDSHRIHRRRRSRPWRR
ncbi:MAG: hypothetical protein ABWX74_11805 [Aeromicrobium sp.]